MFINKDFLKSECEKISVSLDEQMLERFDIFASLLVECNKKMNLTGITEPDEIVIKHFVDSVVLLKYAEIPQESSMIDVGTGAGFPSIPLMIVRDDIRFTLLDSLQKRLTFLDAVLQETGMSADLVHARAEDAAKEKELREKFDFACARAVAPMNVLSELCLPFVKENGSFLAMKGAQGEEKLALAEKAIDLLGGKCVKADTFTIEGCGVRNIFNIKKISQTPPKYPRSAAKISKKPL